MIHTSPHEFPWILENGREEMIHASPSHGSPRLAEEGERKARKKKDRRKEGREEVQEEGKSRRERRERFLAARCSDAPLSCWEQRPLSCFPGAVISWTVCSRGELCG